MELKTPDLISTALGKVTGSKRRGYLSVWFSFFLFLHVLNINTERCMNLTPPSRDINIYIPQQSRCICLMKEYSLAVQQ